MGAKPKEAWIAVELSVFWAAIGTKPVRFDSIRKLAMSLALTTRTASSEIHDQ